MVRDAHELNLEIKAWLNEIEAHNWRAETMVARHVPREVYQGMVKLIGFASLLKAYREKTGETQAQVAERLGISRVYVSDIERGEAANVSFELGAAILNLTGWTSSPAAGLSTVPTFAVVRHEDETGVSGAGIVAYGAVFPNGKAVLAWTVEGKPQSVAVYDSIHDLFAVHVGPHGGKTELRWITLPAELEAWRGFGK